MFHILVWEEIHTHPIDLAPYPDTFTRLWRNAAYRARRNSKLIATNHCGAPRVPTREPVADAPGGSGWIPVPFRGGWSTRVFVEVTPGRSLFAVQDYEWLIACNAITACAASH